MEPKIGSYCDASKSRIGMCVPTKRQGMKKDITTYVSKCFDLLEDIAEGIGNTDKHAYDLSSSNGRTKKCRSPVLWAEIGEIRSIGPELVQETTNKENWTDANMNVPLEEIKVHKTLRFVKEPVEIINRETLCLLNYALMTRHDYDITSSLRREALHALRQFLRQKLNGQWQPIVTLSTSLL
nr:hypothetical protein [Tanacetum cinerariifolium]